MCGIGLGYWNTFWKWRRRHNSGISLTEQVKMAGAFAENAKVDLSSALVEDDKVDLSYALEEDSQKLVCSLGR